MENWIKRNALNDPSACGSNEAQNTNLERFLLFGVGESNLRSGLGE
jgi:hypothetical protein